VLQLSVPRLRGFVNVYAIGGGGNWTLVDSAEASDVSRGALLDVLERKGVLDDGVGQIFLTHGHPDHTGLAQELAALTGATVVAHRSTLAGHVVDAEFLRRHGLEVDAGSSRPPVLPPGAEQVRLAADGDTLEAGRRRFTLVWTPGHHPGQLCALDRASGLLIAGDRVLRIPIGVARYSAADDDPLGDHLRSFERLRRLSLRLVLPGHGRAFADAQGALEQDRRTHLVDLRVVLEAIPRGGADAPAIARRARAAVDAVNRGTVAPRSELLAVGRCLAALRLLALRGLVTVDEAAQPVRFARTEARR
jgi:glyoxylase-like metal-dependent hydrolase (beta-lactamase superfamily II)